MLGAEVELARRLPARQAGIGAAVVPAGAAVAANLTKDGVLTGHQGGDSGLFSGILARYLALVAVELPGDDSPATATRRTAAALITESADGRLGQRRVRRRPADLRPGLVASGHPTGSKIQHGRAGSLGAAVRLDAAGGSAVPCWPAGSNLLPMRVGVVILPQFSWPEARARWKSLEDRGFAHGWTYDHLAWRDLAEQTLVRHHPHPDRRRDRDVDAPAGHLGHLPQLPAPGDAGQGPDDAGRHLRRPRHRRGRSRWDRLGRHRSRPADA